LPLRLIAILLGRLRMSATEALEIYVKLAGDVFSKKNSKLKGNAFEATRLEKAIKDVVADRLGGRDEKMIEDMEESEMERQACKA
jgi:hypothetical protein